MGIPLYNFNDNFKIKYGNIIHLEFRKIGIYFEKILEVCVL